MSTLTDEIRSTISHMEQRGVNPSVIYVDEESYVRLGKRSHMHGLPIVCDDGLCMKYRID